MEVLKSPELKIQYDGRLNIATGKSRKETSWKNRDLLWSELIKKLSKTTYTAETYAEFITSPKPRQVEIKDVGGFVGGFVSGGNRNADSIVNRSLLTLDIDFGTMDIYEDFLLLYGVACALYTTHKHSPGNFRARLLIPLDRPVFKDEYQAISRHVAGVLGINAFDDTTFEPHRLMFWPSTPKDGEYIFEYYDGPWLCADEVLNSYQDWHDASAWPVSDRVDAVVKRDIKKQGDPTEKPGLIGAFCRCFTIQEAIETFLADVYEACMNGRYTYKEGSTAAGLVVYDDKFAYSHHGTDPVGGKLCNAFDLVRLHKYGLKDEDAKENTAANRLPSYTAMVDFVSKLPEVRGRITTEKYESACGDFLDVELDTGEETEADDEWRSKLDVDRKGKIYSTIDNIMIILGNDPRLKDKFLLNDFRHETLIKGNLPWRKHDPEKLYFEDIDTAGLRHYMEKTYEIESIRKIDDGINLLFSRNAFHPVRDYLSSHTWDGEERLDTLLIDYLGAEDTPYIRAVTRKAFTAAVARVFRPGIKFDHVLTLIGLQGAGKSTLLKKMGREWFSESFDTVIGKEAYEQIQGVWIVEIGELAGLKKAEVETVKHFISKQEDIFRPPYGRRTAHHPRQCVFFATTNKGDFLKDPTGARRFWPVDVMIQSPIRSVFSDLDEFTVGQLWAEAVFRYEHKEPLFLTSVIEALAKDQQESHSEENSKVGLIQEYLDREVPENWYGLEVWDRRRYTQGDIDFIQPDTKFFQREKVCVAEIWVELFQGDIKTLDKIRASEIRDAMKKVEGWEEYDLTKDKGRLKFGNFYGKQKAYIKTNPVTPSVTPSVTPGGTP